MPIHSADTIAADRPCPRCGYNLRGLPVPGRCPECSEVIRRPRPSSRFTDTLADAPFYFLRPLAAGLILMAAASIGLAISFSYARGEWKYYGAAWGVVFAGGWWVGVWIATRPRPILVGTVPDLVLDSPRVRSVIRLTQLVWLVAAAGWAVAAYAPLVAPPAGISPPPGFGPLPAEIMGVRIALVAEGIGLLTMVPLSVFLASLAAWAGDDGLAERYRIAAWGLAAGGLIGIASTVIAGIPSPVAGFMSIVAIFAWGIAALAQLLVVICLAQLAYAAVWAISNAHTRSQVESRIARKQAQYEQELAQRVATADAAAKSKPSPRVAPIGGSFDGNILPRARGGAAPYPVEPGEAEE